MQHTYFDMGSVVPNRALPFFCFSNGKLQPNGKDSKDDYLSHMNQTNTTTIARS